jgi:hypothetical protein
MSMSEETYPQRAIFRFFDGLRNRCADPVRLYRKLNHLCDGDVNKVWADVYAGVTDEGEDPMQEPIRYQAEEKLLAAAREAFGLAPFNEETGEGADDDCCWLALKTFGAWTQKKSASTETTPTSPPLDSSPPSQPQQPQTNMNGGLATG